MVDRDFFGFCTTLKLLELKAIGELSQTRHLAAGETIYAPGDPGDAFYIINRGVVEAVRSSAKEVSDTYLSRGDIFGDVEVLTERPRKYLVRTREPVSLQCFHRENFPELVRRVPSFFQYLSEQLAFRLAQARDLTLSESHCLELSGSLSNFDLVTVYQTIVNSSQTGELRVSNESSQLISAFYFEKGQPRCGQFEHLTGEEAFSQLFLSEALAGTFSFSSGDRLLRAGMQEEEFTRNPSEMLINALQGRDELSDLKRRMFDGSATLNRRGSNLVWPAGAPARLRPVAEEIWKSLGDGPVILSSLFRQCSYNELKIYEAVDELAESQQLDLSQVGAVQKVA
ncbi:MAG TPA: cyclic nucleotide-binding domain-containing protein [Chthoniobacterales bacterium]|nr:cyclic nucleotide-binding domain-containing protein [Chthoniobacterales bacterium]